jgi:Toxic anion resistance protein (TelA)
MNHNSQTDWIKLIKSNLIPQCFANTSTIGEFAKGIVSSERLKEAHALLEQAPVSRLARHLEHVLLLLSGADPRKVAKPATWYERFTGKALEAQVAYLGSRKSIDIHLDESNESAVAVRSAIDAMDQLIASHQSEVFQLAAYIQAAQEYLQENPLAGLSVKQDAGDQTLDFDKPRERFARKVANLATLLSSHELSITQMRLTRAQAIDLLDRFEETITVLIPVWRQNNLAVASMAEMTPEMVAKASAAHEALKKSLETTSKQGV